MVSVTPPAAHPERFRRRGTFRCARSHAVATPNDRKHTTTEPPGVLP
jgi:hypothetical protein